MRHLLTACLTTLLLAASPARAADVPLAVGTWVDAKGDFDSKGTFRAREIELFDDDEPEIKGPIDALDPASSELVFGALRVGLESETRLEDASGASAALSALTPGRRVKVALAGGAAWTADRVRLLGGAGGSLSLRGAVEALDDEDPSRFRLLGVWIHAEPHADWSGIEAPPGAESDPPPEPAPAPARTFEVGSWVSAKGDFDGDRLVARQVQVVTDRDTGIKGPVSVLEDGGRTLGFGPVRIRLDDATSVRDDSGRPTRASALHVGERLKIRLSLRGGQAHVKRVSRLGSTGGSTRVEGRVASIAGDGTSFVIEGFETPVTTDDGTDWIGLAGPGVTGRPE